MSVEPLTTSYYTHGRLAEVRRTLLDVYADVYAEDIATDPFFSMERFEERLEAHGAAGGWGCVVAEVGGEVAGFTYGFTARDDGTTFKLCENMLREKWRKRGISQVMHGELVGQRAEARAELLVRRERPRLRAMYEGWGYAQVGEKLPFPDSPLYDVMVLALR
ncbi:GNAT family N-acetyltransferase [Streptomyces griseiscabiei]|uniref:GNAT family N-acetyltransferase n=1 Tax=Streptomyces griseiscabiei TaxID=2993540 RepID=A0ABU4LD79_9ACTN|nr:GNAT family N-acetyltransferase [Streptomyces griseiscabiei]MBZ3906651.1 GNAT family N-acetyltransferase [Streptomyces griseiscabiei]MDX2913715.1 GNAT family N-acetyltransferase [Streptomyces griseiscabiei]